MSDTNQAANHDEQELTKFAQDASSWWDYEGPFKPLHDINPLRLDYVEQCVDGVHGLTVLDVGCGGGIFAEALARAGAKVTALDLVEESLEVARLHQLDAGLTIDYRLQSVEQHLASEGPEQYDLVTCLEMLEHVPNPAQIVGAVAQLVKPGGSVIMSTLNRSAKGFALGIVAAEYVLNYVPRGTHEFAKFIKPSELAAMARAAQLHTVDGVGLHHNPLTKSYWLSKKNVDVNYFLHTKKPVTEGPTNAN